MPAPRSIKQYPPEILELWQLVRDRDVRVPVRSRAAGQNLRHRLYAFRTLYRAEVPVELSRELEVKDWRVVDDAGQVFLESYENEWKAFVRAAREPAAPAQAGAETAGPSIGASDAAASGTANGAASGADALSSTLRELGFAPKGQ